MNFKELQKNWDEFGKQDPLWSILTTPSKRGGGWEINEFFKTGERDAQRALNFVKSCKIEGFPHKTALDFGCGAGRVTQALSKHFSQVYGVDVAPSMIRLAKEYNQERKGKCRFYLNGKDDLSIFPDNKFDFIYSIITLQHMHPRYAKNYLKEFLRILKPKGLMVFEIPSEFVVKNEFGMMKKLKRKFLNLNPQIVFWYDRIKAKFKGEPVMEVYVTSRSQISRLMKENGAEVLKVKEYRFLRIKSCFYCVQKF